MKGEISVKLFVVFIVIELFALIKSIRDNKYFEKNSVIANTEVISIEKMRYYPQTTAKYRVCRASEEKNDKTKLKYTIMIKQPNFIMRDILI